MSFTTKSLASSCSAILLVAAILALPLFGLAASAAAVWAAEPALTTGSGPVPGETVLGDKVLGDKVLGDKILGDKILGDKGLLPGWTYKTPVTITNPGAVVADYQVRIDLNTGNFTFAQANSDGSDIRFTATDGTTLLPYWGETWQAGVSGTFWVRVPSIPAGGSTTIYMYSGNVSATSASDGSTTFTFFEGFEALPWTAWTKEGGPGTFVQSADQAKRGTESGKLVTDGTSGSTVFSRAASLPGTDFVQEWDFYDDLDATAFKMVRANYAIPSGQIGLGVWTGSSSANYAWHNTGYGYTPTSAARSVGWHKMGITVSGGSANFSIDGGSSLGTLTGLPATFNRLSVEGIPDGPTTYHVDDFRVRKYIAQTLTVAIGQAGSSAVDMAIAMTDVPDPVRVGQSLTYTLTVNNYGDLGATNVTVTDVLPATVTLFSATSSQGSCSGTGTITGNLGDIASGGSATVTIVVTTTAQGQLSNTATVTCTETDANPANNSVTGTTGVGDPVVYIVNAVDTEPFDDHIMTPQHRPFDLHNFIKGQSTYIEPLMASGFRNANRDTYGTPFKMTWFMEMDNYINNGVFSDGSPMNYLTLYDTFESNYGTEIDTWGDEMANHHHFMTWNGSSWVQMTDGAQLGTTYDEHNNALDRMILDGGFFPTDFRSGWLWSANQVQAWVEQWMLADLSGPFGGNPTYFTYHPSATNYAMPGNMNHWITGADGSGPNATTLAAAFAQAAATGKPVIYSWYCHDRENMSANITTVQSLATAAATSSGVPFRYATAKEAMQVVMSTTDTTPPVLAVSHTGGDIFSITSSEAVWNGKPYAAARYLGADGLEYVHTAATSAGTNNWTVAFPDERTITTVIPGVKYPLVGATASEYENANVPGLAIDGNEGTYWASAVLPAWIAVDAGAVRSVPRMTVHFYDGDARTYTYSVDASADGTNWTQIVASTTTHGTATYDFPSPISMRYAKVTVTGASANAHAHIFEICLYQTAPGSTQETAYLQQVGVGAGDLSGNTSVATTIIRALADVAVTVTATPPSVILGNNLTYNVTVTNHGPSEASGISVTDVLPAGVDYVSVTGGNYDSGTRTVSAALASLAAEASATVTIVVHPTAEGTYVNTASVTSTSPDPTQTNNSATVTVTVGNPIVYVVSAVDTEPFDDHNMTPLHRPFDLHNYIRGQSTYIGPLMESTFRNANLDSYGTPFKMTWFMEMDGYINNGIYPDGSPMNYLTLYNTFKSNYGTEIAAWGDEMANHHHFMTWNGTTWVQLTDGAALGTTYDEHNNALDRMVLDAGFFPTTYRSGWLWESTQLQAWIEQWMLADYGYGGSPSQPSGMNHWNLGCDGGPNQANINAAFAQAAATGKPVIYGWYCHDRENMPGNISTLQSYVTAAQASSGVPFKYATAKQAMQAVMTTTDFTPPVLAVTAAGGNNFSITSNEPVWNGTPYVAARYLAPSGLTYQHTIAVSAGTTSWTAEFPDQQMVTSVVPATKYPLVGVTASSFKPGWPASNAIDGNETTYWDSYALPQWISVDAGSVKPVSRMTVHFFDLDGRNYTYSIDASADGTVWTEIVPSTTVSGTATHDFNPVAIPAANLRFARVNITAGSAGPYGHILEICLYQTVGGGTVQETAYLQQVGAGAGDLSGNTSVASAIVRSLADVAVTLIAAPSSVELGGDLTYNVTVTNNGPSPAPAVQVTDVLPVGVTFVSTTPGTYSSETRTVTAALGNILSGASATIAIVVHPTAVGTYVNTASAAAALPSTDPNLTNNSASVSTTVSLALADVAVTMTATPTSVKLGNDLTYNLTVTNHGPSAASGVVGTDVLPAGATFVSAISSQGSCSGTTTVTATLGDLASGASATVAIVVHPTAEGTYVNTASVTASSATTDPVLTNNAATVSTTVGNPLVYVVIAIDTEADNNHPMGSLHTVFDVHNYQHAGTDCGSFTTKYAGDGSTWEAYIDGTTFNFAVTPTGGSVAATGYACGFNNAYGLDDFARAVAFTVPETGAYNVGLQLSVTGAPPATNIYVVPDVGGNPDPNLTHALSTYAATPGGFTSGDYVVVGPNLTLTAGQTYWWVASKQSSGDDLNQFAVYQGSAAGSNTFSQIMDPSFRSATTDGYGRSFRMTWYMEMDNFINNGLYADGRPMNYLTLYNELMNNWGTEVHGYGDEIANHHHFMWWDAPNATWQMGGQEHATDGQYDWHNEALDRMVLDAGFYPTNFRAGWLNNDNQLQAWVEQRMLSDDGGVGWATGWQPYHPSVDNYTTVGDMKHWIMNDPGGPSQESVNSAFAQTIAENRPVVYGWYMHQRDDMRGLVASAHTMLQTAAAANPGVTFKYVTAQEAMRAVIGTTDVTPPVLAIVPAVGDVYTITSTETLLGAGPYVAGRYGTGSAAVYTHVAVTPGGSANTWTASLPALNGTLPLELVGAGALDLAGNSAVAARPTSISTVTALVSSLNPSVVLDAVTLTAHVTPVPAGGTVTFRDGSGELETQTLLGGVATMTTSSLAAGTHVLTARYNGGIGYDESMSGALSQMVNPSSSTIDVGPVAGMITNVTSTSTIPVRITRNSLAPDLRGYKIVFSVSAPLALASGLSGIAEGEYLSTRPQTTTSFLKTDRGNGVYEVSGAILGSPCGTVGLTGTLFYVTVTSAVGQVGSGMVTSSEVLVRDCGNESMLASIGSTATVVVDRSSPTVAVTSPNITETWFVGSAHDITWTATDNDSVASIDIDYSTNNGTSWIPVAAGEGNDGTYAWTVPNTPTSLALVRVTAHDGNGNTGSDASDAPFAIAYAPVGAIADLVAAQVRTGNNPAEPPFGSTTRVALTWTARPIGTTVEVWRYGFGDYPEYDRAHDAVPSASATYLLPDAGPGAGWTKTAVNAPGGTDLPMARDFYYYVAYVKDAYGTWSPASAVTGGTLNYHLGDVSDGTTAGTGNNLVYDEDISLLGAHYGAALLENDPLGYLDVGPTTNSWIDGRPTPDNRVEFEDLVMFGLNYNAVSKASPRPAAAASDVLVLEVPALVKTGETVEARVRMRGTGQVFGLSVALKWDPAQVTPTSVTAGDLSSANGAVLLSPGPGVADATVLGTADGGITGDGDLVVFRFRALADGVPVITMDAVKARDGRNRGVTVPFTTTRETSVTAPPALTQLSPAQPNPFSRTSTISFSLAEAGAIDLALYAANGARVRTLARGAHEPGIYSLTWDGRDDGNAVTAAGVYYVRLTTGRGQFSRTVVCIR